MAHKTLIGGTAYDVKGGRTLLGGTGYNIKGGRTLLGGTGYNISFGTPVGTLAVGSSVFMDENGSRVEFIICYNGNPNAAMYDASCNGVWLVRKAAHSQQQWNNYDVNTYGTSAINSWLNSTYLNSLNTKNLIKQVKIPYLNGNGESGSVATLSQGLSVKTFLLSACELCLGNNSYYPPAQDGSPFDFFNTQSSRRIGKLWWTRSAEMGGTLAATLLDYDGNLSITRVDSAIYWARPAMILPLNAAVDDNFNVIV